ncbi:MAG: TolB protein [Thermoleophilaceae bacterium]|nr:TolB protein [Thermoleophilaceae bacterium]
MVPTRRASCSAALLSGCLLALVAGPATAAPTTIVFADQVAGVGPYDLFSVEPDGSDLRHLTHGGADDTTPAWSPDRRRIAFARLSGSADGLFTIAADGTHARRIPHTHAGDDPAWSPNGKRIAFTVMRPDLKSAVFTIRPDGKHRRRLTSYSLEVFNADWSPDGQSIVYESRKAIKVMRANGRHKRVLIHDGTAPSWSPDGQRIAFGREGQKDGVAVTDILTVALDGSDLRNLTSSRPGVVCTPAENCARLDEIPSWSSDGSQIAFEELTAAHGSEGVFTVDAGGTEIRQVTRSGREPDW